ncbi:uncharacterized protein MONOS_11745 [Monocercomonoides exilis]|uniref:uncharacterized protein n=1 Tax=Monocercomonoides exilis TaxID=2049356 RepID=UPI003559AA77|nr:hypothetical protein MONOS_11745 [Monocercomonoides exilis]|eukprot:MONOS_11745.1-p1 / transcript=MONOS_11745.1 / gene=MONOS_11745 / organism=Monocercomonoides_exilis_PA203 / gene_product=unspecified product / transcript_product=unspecified product / location=Mono_scaffold00607:21165-23432(+) / protein_length=756 / sequence_SO=supercontig / SO=protein_coding / is_pseudo=false
MLFFEHELKMKLNNQKPNNLNVNKGSVLMIPRSSCDFENELNMCRLVEKPSKIALDTHEEKASVKTASKLREEMFSGAIAKNSISKENFRRYSSSSGTTASETFEHTDIEHFRNSHQRNAKEKKCDFIEVQDEREREISGIDLKKAIRIHNDDTDVRGRKTESEKKELCDEESPLDWSMAHWKPLQLSRGEVSRDVEVEVDGKMESRIGTQRGEELKNKWNREDRELMKRESRNGCLIRSDAGARIDATLMEKQMKGENENNAYDRNSDDDNNNKEGECSCLSVNDDNEENAKIEERRKDLVMRQIKDAEKHFRTFGVWVTKSWMRDEWEEGTWKSAYEKIVCGDELIDGQKNDSLSENLTLEEMQSRLHSDGAEINEEMAKRLIDEVNKEEKKQMKIERFTQMSVLDRYMEMKKKEKEKKKKYKNLEENYETKKRISNPTFSNKKNEKFEQEEIKEIEISEKRNDNRSLLYNCEEYPLLSVELIEKKNERNSCLETYHSSYLNQKQGSKLTNYQNQSEEQWTNDQKYSIERTMQISTGVEDEYNWNEDTNPENEQDALKVVITKEVDENWIYSTEQGCVVDEEEEYLHELDLSRKLQRIERFARWGRDPLKKERKMEELMLLVERSDIFFVPFFANQKLISVNNERKTWINETENEWFEKMEKNMKIYKSKRMAEWKSEKITLKTVMMSLTPEKRKALWAFDTYGCEKRARSLKQKQKESEAHAFRAAERNQPLTFSVSELARKTPEPIITYHK